MKLTVPSERNFEIYHAVDTQGLSRREAAAAYGVSATRVQQIVEQVRYYIAQFGSDDLMFLPPQLAELASLRMNYERLRFLYSHLMKAWQQSQAGISTADMATANQSPPAMLMPAPGGNLRLVQQAVRIAVQQTKMAGRMAQVQQQLAAQQLLPMHEPIEAIEQGGDDDDLALPLPPLPFTPSLASASEPPARGCTATLSTGPANAVDISSAPRATFDPDAILDDLNKALARRQAKQSRESHPAQRKGKT